jgi:hypothetical protein
MQINFFFTQNYCTMVVANANTVYAWFGARVS